MSIIINHNEDKNDYQNHYEFLKTDEGYKLIKVVASDKKMK